MIPGPIPKPGSQIDSAAARKFGLPWCPYFFHIAHLDVVICLYIAQSILRLPRSSAKQRSPPLIGCPIKWPLAGCGQSVESWGPQEFQKCIVNTDSQIPKIYTWQIAMWAKQWKTKCNKRVGFVRCPVQTYCNVWWFGSELNHPWFGSSLMNTWDCWFHSYYNLLDSIKICKAGTWSLVHSLILKLRISVQVVVVQLGIFLHSEICLRLTNFN